MSGVDVSAQPAVRARRGRLAGVADAVFPVSAVRARWWEVLFVLVAGSAAALFRLGGTTLHGTIFAEDGRIFLGPGHTEGLGQTLTQSYNGYLHTVPRLLAAATVVMPLRWEGLAFSVFAAVGAGCAAAVVYQATSGFLERRWPRLVAAAAVVAVPVGPEVIDVVASLQWFLILGAAFAVFWTPQRRTGYLAPALMIMAGILSSPWGVIILGLAALRLLLRHDRASGFIAAVTALAFGLQTWAMAIAPPRGGAKLHGVNVLDLGNAYLLRVLGDGLFGIGRLPVGKPSTSRTLGFVALGLLLFLATAVAARHGWRVLLFPALLMATSLAFFVAPILVTVVPVDNPFMGSRYYVPSVILLLTVLALLVGRALSGWPWPALSLRWPVAACAVGTVGCIAYALVTSYISPGTAFGRDSVPPWTQTVGAAEKACLSLPPSTMYNIPIAPPGWSLTVPCRTIENG